MSKNELKFYQNLLFLNRSEHRRAGASQHQAVTGDCETAADEDVGAMQVRNMSEEILYSSISKDSFTESNIKISILKMESWNRLEGIKIDSLTREMIVVD